MSSAGFAAIVLAAGKGTRMKSDLPKVMHPLANRPLIGHVLGVLEPLRPECTVVVVAPGMESVAAAAAPARIAVQERALGTGHAALAGCPALDDLVAAGAIADVLVLFGDTPLLTAATLQALLAERRRAPAAAAVVLGMRPADPGEYGRLVRAGDGTLEAIVEAKDAGPEELTIGLCNSGVMAIEARRLRGFLEALRNDNAKGEYYLTDIVQLARSEGLPCRVVEASAEELAGINSRADLAAAEAIIQCRLRAAAMAGGATLTAPETVFLSADTRIGRDVTIGPFVYCGPEVVIEDGAQVLSFCHFTGARIAKGAIIGPFARLRPGAEIGEEAHIGNFVEVKKARIGRGAKANHLAYVGDAEVGAKANIGAGTITCNYDGFFKELTRIGEGAFIGSNTVLVAPVSVGAGAYIAAGSAIVSDVPADALSVGRGRQVDKPGRAAAIRAQKTAEKEARRKRGQG